jgi:hypothetical protein
MAEMSRGDMMRRLDGASKDLLKRLVRAGIGADGPPAKDETGATRSIVDHLAADDVGETREDV